MHWLKNCVGRCAICESVQQLIPLTLSTHFAISAKLGIAAAFLYRPWKIARIRPSDSTIFAQFVIIYQIGKTAPALILEVTLSQRTRLRLITLSAAICSLQIRRQNSLYIQIASSPRKLHVILMAVDGLIKLA